MHTSENGRGKPAALALLSSERPRNVGWKQAAGLLFGDWGTSRLYVLGIALFFAGRTSFWLILMMSVLILGVGWAYSQICRIYPDGGGVYTAAKHRSRMLAVIGALLLFADYTVTASLSSLDAFHYFGLPVSKHVQTVNASPSNGASGQPEAKLTAPPVTQDEGPDAGDQLDVKRESAATEADKLWAIDSPALWAIVSIIAIGFFNLMGPKHTGGFALAAAVGMVFITILISAFAIPQVSWRQLPHYLGHVHHDWKDLWVAFVAIVLALSGVEAIANLTGVMHKPVAATARKAIFVVALEVALFNLLLAAVMLNVHPLNRDAHQEDMLAFLAGHYVGGWGELGVRILGGVLLLSATNTAITDMISIQYLMARDGELPQALAMLNRFGVPWLPALLAASVPVLVLLFSHDLDSLAALYAIGVIGAVAINVTLCSIHPRLRRMSRKIPMLFLGLVLLAIWITLAFTKLHALVFVTIVMIIGLSARAGTKWLQNRRGVRPSLLRQAIAEQLTPDALAQPKVLLGTYGSDALAPAALSLAKQSHSTLVVCFIREVTLSFKYEGRRLTIDTDLAAVRAFSRILDTAHQMGVPILPVYDSGANAAELIAETAAIYGCQSVLIGTSRQGALYHLIKGHFQRRLESILPPDIQVQVVSASDVAQPSEEPATAKEPQHEPEPEHHEHAV